MTKRRVGPRRTEPRRQLSGRRLTSRRSSEDNVRMAAGWVLERTLASQAPAEAFLEGVLERFDDRDQNLLRQLVMGTLRWLRCVDHVISEASHRRFDQIEEPLRAPLRIATFQLLFLRHIPAHAAVHEAVEQARNFTHRGGASFVNAVLRRIAREPDAAAWPVQGNDPVRRLGIGCSHPDFLVQRWLRRFGRERTEALLEANNRPKPLQLLAFRDRGGRELLAEELIDEGLEIEPSLLSPLGLTVRRGNPFQTTGFGEGRFYVQDEASQVAALIPPPRPRERILDAAAAPGGKSFALLGWEPDLEPVLADVSLERLSILRSNLCRLARSLRVVTMDAGRCATRGDFDRVVLDLPCSGTGTLRKHPELKWRLSESEIRRLAEQGRRLVEGVGSLVRRDGLLIVITCSLEEEENEEVVLGFLSRHPEFLPVRLEELLPKPWIGFVEAPGRWRMLPADDHDGFSVSVLRRFR